MYITKLDLDDKLNYYDLVNDLSTLKIEEKFQLLFSLMEHLNMAVYRARYDKSILVIHID